MAKELTFIKNLDAEQIEYAMKVRQAAEALGVNPTLALSIAYHESKFRPNVKRGEDGEVGLMQIKPTTAAGLGYTMQDILKPEKNIEAGVKYIKEALDVTGNDIRLAPIYYNGGPGTFNKFASGQDYDPKVDSYLKALKGYNTFEAFDPSQLTEPKAPSSTPLPAVEVKDPTKAEIEFEDRGQKELTRDEFGLYGGAAGTAAALSAAGTPLATNMATKAIGNILAQVEQAKAQNLPPAPPAPQGAPAGGLPTAQNAPQSVVRLPQGGNPPTQAGGAPARGYGTFNYGVSQGLTDIESGLAKDMTKEAGGVHDLLTQRREGMNKLQSMGANNYVENPRFGGIMTEAPSVGGGVRVDPTTGVPQSFAMRTPEGGQGPVLSPIPKAPAIPTVAPPPSGLDQVKTMFNNFMRQTAKAVPYVAAPFAGYSLGRDVADLYMGYEQPKEERDYLDLGLTGLGALSTVGSYTPLAPVAIPASIAAPAVRNLRRTLIEKSQSPEEQAFINREPTEEELLMARQPAFRYARP